MLERFVNKQTNAYTNNLWCSVTRLLVDDRKVGVRFPAQAKNTFPSA
jgi:hypothetical protein